MLEKIVSGGQTGADRAGLDVAILHGIEIGGWCPKGRLDENGVIPSIYSKLVEHCIDTSCDAENYNTRTKLNIRDSDGTIIFIPKSPLPESIKDGTKLTITEATNTKKPFLVIDLSSDVDTFDDVVDWINTNDIKILNIAGPRASSSEGIYQYVYQYLDNLLPELSQSKTCSM